MRKSYLLIAAAALTLAAATAQAADALPSLHADPARVSISGLSSGAFMAVQYDVAFSASTMGVGVVAGGPYNCAWVNLGGISTCMQGSPAANASYEAAVGFAAAGQIDPVANLAKGKVYLFSGSADSVVHTSAVNATTDFFKQAGVSGDNLLYVNTMPAGHAFISPTFGNLCDANAAPYVSECKDANGKAYDQPGAILGHIYGSLKAKAKTLSSQVAAFDQSEFASSLSGLADTGYVYIPAACKKKDGAGCAVHVVFHGCLQGAKEVGDDVYGKTGYNEWADTNKIVVLYPQVNPTTIPFNLQGCWDWWGYSGLNFQVKSAPQLSAVHAMVERLTAAQ